MRIEKDVVEFRLNNKIFDHVKSYSLSWDIFQACGNFNAVIDNNYIVDLAGKSVSFSWVVNGVMVMSGYLDRVEKSYSKTSFEQAISGRDMMQVLVDNMIIKAKTYPKKSVVKTIIEDILNSSINTLSRIGTNGKITDYIITPAGWVNAGKVPQGTLAIPKLSVSYTDQATQTLTTVGPVEEIKARYGQTLHDFISDLLNGMGLMLYHIPGTNEIKVHRLLSTDESEMEKPMSYNTDGTIATDDAWPINNFLSNNDNNVIEASFSTDISSYYKFRRLVGSTQDEQTYQQEWEVEKAVPTYLIIDKIGSNSTKRGYMGLTKFASSITDTASATVWRKAGNSLINNALMQQNRQLYNVKYTMHGHSPSGQAPYHINHLAMLHDEMIPIIDDVMLVYGVTFRANKNSGQTTVLELGLPGGFNNYISESLNKTDPGRSCLK